jgi:hypothetical protein
MVRLALIVAIGLAACAHSTTLGSSGRRARYIADLEQKVLAAGPAVVSHIGTAGDGTLFLYSAPARTGTDDDCAVTDAEMQPYFPIEAGVGRDVNLSVPPGSVECAAVAMGIGMDVTWIIAPSMASASSR